MGANAKSRVVVTGMGVVAPNAVNLETFRRALCEGRSGLSFVPRLKELDFGCQVAGVPQVSDETAEGLLGPEVFRNSNTSMRYALLASIECWRDAGLADPRRDSDVDWDTAAVIGTCIGGIDTIGDLVVPETNAGRVRRLGSSAAERTMSSCMSAAVGGLLGLGGQVTTNSSACSTGSEALLQAYWMLREGRCRRVLSGSSEGASIYTWACLDAMRVTMRRSNENPEAAARPMSASAGGLVPSCGAGILMLERLDSAESRGARIYAELLGGCSNSGGQRNGGSITASNPEGITRCVEEALDVAKVLAEKIDYINGHLTGTSADAKEVKCLAAVLRRKLGDMPMINGTKSMIGHGLGASGSMESVATVLQLAYGFTHPSKNCEDLHPELTELAERIPHAATRTGHQVALKTSFGFGDVNCALVFRRWNGIGA